MFNTKTTKRALLSSVLSLIICFTMLLGTTFAWFTDSAISADNKIVAGTLDVELYQWTSETESTNISASSDPVFSGDILWEPGKTEVVYLSIKNEGSLALKYQVALEVTGESADSLLDVMSYTITPDAKYGEVNAWAGNGIYVDSGVNATDAVDVALAPDAEHFFALSIHMDEEAGNEYQSEWITFDIKVLAAQLAYEEDSFDNTYDEDATYPVVSAPVKVPANATEGKTVATPNVTVDIPADVLNLLPNEVEAIQLAHSEMTVDTRNNTVIFDAVEFVDQNGKIIDLAALNNTEEITVKLNVGNAFAEGTVVNITHDGEKVAEVAVDADGFVTYTATHFCEVTVAEKFIIKVVFTDGYTKGFNSLKDAMRYGYSGGAQESIIVYDDITEAMDYLEGNIVCGKEGGVTITNTIVDEWIYCDDTNFTIGEGVTYDASGYNSGLFLYGDDCVINGTVITDCYYQRYEGTKLTINAPGSMTVKTETFILRYTSGDGDAGIYINGDNNDETVELNLAVAYFYQGMISAKDATLKVGTYWQTNETDYNEGTANLVLDNSKLTVTVNEHNFKATGNSTVTLKNGSVLDVAGGIETTNVIVVDDTSIVKSAR